MENFFLGLELLRSEGHWKGFEDNYAPLWRDGFLSLPAYRRACSEETVKKLESFGFSWGITGMLHFPAKEGRHI